MPSDPILSYARPAEPTTSITARGVATVLCRLIAIWMFAQALQGLAGSVAYLLSAVVDARVWQARLSYGLIGLATIVGPLAAGWLLWSTAGWVARRVVPDDVVVRPVGDPNLRPLITAGLVMVGASTVAWAIHDLVGAAVLTSQRHVMFSLWWHDPSWLRAFWSNVTVLILAAWLIFGGRGIVDLIHRARTAGQAPMPVTDRSSAG